MAEKKLRKIKKQDREVAVPKAEKFIEDLLAVCRKHRMSLENEDNQGALVVIPMDDNNDLWCIMDAMVHPAVLSKK